MKDPVAAVGSQEIGVRANTVLIDPSNPAHVELASQLVSWRTVSVHEVVGLDVLEAPRVCVVDWRLFAKMDHLRERLQQLRGAVTVVVGLSGERIQGADGLAALRRHAGRVLVVGAVADPELAGSLMVPVMRVSVGDSDGDPVRDVAAAIQGATKQELLDLGSVEVHLHEAMSYAQRQDHAGAFSSAARALSMAPDQPGIVADVARLLGRMGRSGEGEQLCKIFLLQRPDSEPVKQALNELQPIGS